MDENAYQSHPPERFRPTNEHQHALAKLEEYYNDTSAGLCCGKHSLIPRVKNIQIEKHSVYVAQICALAEQRQLKTRTRAYTDHDTYANEPVGDIWKDYEFDPPQTTKLDPPELSKHIDLDRTSRREPCSECPDGRASECSSCKGKCSVVRWSRLNAKWLNHSYTVEYHTNKQKSYPPSILRTPSRKTKCVNFDGTWSPKEGTLDSILDSRLPETFRDEINEKFCVHRQSDRIVRLKCLIEQVRIEKVDYQLNDSPNEKFTFYLVGEDRTVYPTDSSYPLHAQSCPLGCSLL